MSELDELRPAAPDPYAVGVLPERYVVVVDESGPGPALSWALEHASRRSVPVLLAGPPGQFVFSRSYLETIARGASTSRPSTGGRGAGRNRRSAEGWRQGERCR